jgi:hypothetical protein
LEYPDPPALVEARVRAAVQAGGWAIFDELRRNTSRAIYVCRGRENRVFSFSATGEGFGDPLGPGALSMISIGRSAVGPRRACPAAEPAPATP